MSVRAAEAFAAAEAAGDASTARSASRTSSLRDAFGSSLTFADIELRLPVPHDHLHPTTAMPLANRHALHRDVSALLPIVPGRRNALPPVPPTGLDLRGNHRCSP
jgi:hypothetical protein